MPQAMQLRSGKDLAEHETRLLDLKVQDMRASRPEDVQEILAKIHDKQAFNAAVQELIFNDRDGLLASWRRKDAEGQMANIGRLVRWGSLAEGSSIVWQHWAGN